MILLSKKC